MSGEILQGRMMEKLKRFREGYFDAVVTDPPYGLSFMGKKWDYAVPSVVEWAECLRVLKPGGHLLSFFGTRTYHRGVVNVEDAGFEIRDQLAWVYGSGFPKSLDVSKAIDKAAGVEREILGHKDPRGDFDGVERNSCAINTNWRDAEGRDDVLDMSKKPITVPATDEARQWNGWGTALKPAWEPIVLARKPIEGTVAANVLEHGTGALNIDGGRVGLNGDYKCGANGRPSQTGLPDNYNPLEANMPSTEGRWPANLIHDGSEEVLAEFPHSKSGAMKKAYEYTNNGHSMGAPSGSTKQIHDSNEGSAARFFYCAKASKTERGEGNNHPTVKPLALMRYLCRLITPPSGIILDPYCGSGSTCIAAHLEGFRFVAIDKEQEYIEIAERRLAKYTEQHKLELA